MNCLFLCRKRSKSWYCLLPEERPRNRLPPSRPCNPGPPRSFSKRSGILPLRTPSWSLLPPTSPPHREELGEALLQNPNLTDHVRGWLEGALSLIAEARCSDVSEPPTPAPPEVATGESRPEPQKPQPTTAIQRAQRMSVVQKVKAALTGTKEERMLLIRDSNKLVARAVAQSPKLTEEEVEKYASMKDVCEDALRVITLNRKFMKLYVVVKALVNNPRTPIDVGLHLLPRVNEFDLKRLASNRNVADVIRHTAEKIVQRKEDARKPKFQGSKF